jgi:hypothetical protein
MRLSMGKAKSRLALIASNQAQCGEDNMNYRRPLSPADVIELVAKIPEWERLFCAIAFMAWLAERLA